MRIQRRCSPILYFENQSHSMNQKGFFSYGSELFFEILKNIFEFSIMLFYCSLHLLIRDLRV